MSQQTELQSSVQRPQWSGDRRWWWDGTKWIPAAEASGPPPPSASGQLSTRTPQRRGARRIWIALAAVAALAVLGFGGLQVWGATHMINIDTSVQATNHTVVGGASDLTVTVTNTGSDIKDFVMYARVEGADDWFKHHAVTDNGACSVNGSAGRFECGPIARGSTQVFTIHGRAIDAGAFHYVLTYADHRSDLPLSLGTGWATRQNDWNEEVLP